jgi:hypothetical protein
MKYSRHMVAGFERPQKCKMLIPRRISGQLHRQPRQRGNCLGLVLFGNGQPPLTGGVLACNALAAVSFKNCIDAAVKVAMDSALKDFKTRQTTLSAE